jgi:acetoin utilization deacetylase AcuC-like enzyme
VLRQERLALHPLVIDLDVHQGNGTASIFAADPLVFTLSLHGEKNFPFRKESSDLDVDLPDGTSDDDYLAALRRSLDSVLATFTPDFIFYLAGADPHEGDRLGRLKLTHQGLLRRDQMVFEFAERRDVPIVAAMAGGYGRVVDDTVLAHLHTVQCALDSHATRRARVAV